MRAPLLLRSDHALIAHFVAVRTRGRRTGHERRSDPSQNSVCGRSAIQNRGKMLGAA